jgi:phosphotransferase system  glucose/maltose/N-acetylglucosamine-specific IIC component
MIVGGLTMSVVIMAQILPAYYNELIDDDAERQKVEQTWYSFLANKTFVEVALVISSIISGLGMAFIWIAQGEYVALCASEETKGFYFGYFWLWYMSA